MDKSFRTDFAIQLSNVSKIYHTYSSPRHRLLEILSRGRRRYARETRALNDVSLVLERGGRLGVVGENGSGKSTLLKVLAGVLTPTSGSATVNGRVSALLELGAGFNPELNGIENIRQFCMLHGMQQDEVENALPHIVSFSELAESVAHPVKTYSSGMAMRLGFACAVYVKPDILIVDEALSVGDAYFQNKCLHKIKSMLDEGTSFIYVTHAADAIRSLCNTGLWMEKGIVRMTGSSAAVGAAYQSAMFNRLVRSGLADVPAIDEADAADGVEDTTKYTESDGARRKTFAERVDALRTGSGEIRIEDISLVSAHGQDTDSIEIRERIRIRVFFKVKSPPPSSAALSVGVTDTYGRQIFHFNSALKGILASDVPPHSEAVIEFEFENTLCPGEYGIIAGVGTLERHPQNNDLSVPVSVIDYCVGGARFSVRFPHSETGEYDLWGVVISEYSVSMTNLS